MNRQVTQFFGKLAATTCLAAASTLMFAACGGDDDKASCAAGEVNATVIVSGTEVSGCYAACVNGTCSGDATCNSGVCVPANTGNNTGNNANNTGNNANNTGNNANNTGNNANNTGNNANNTGNNANNTGNNANNTGNNANNTGNNANNTNEPTEADIALCEMAADKVFGQCIRDNCTVSAEVQTSLDQGRLNFLGQNNQCARDIANDAEVRMQITALANATCDDLAGIRCGNFGLAEECGCSAPTTVGDACADDATCQAGQGDFSAFCIPATDQNNMATGFDGGYCTTQPCVALQEPGQYLNPAQCGTGNACLTFQAQDGSLAGTCLAGCTQQSDCRSGYACAIGGAASENSLFRTCLPLGDGCSSNQDCGNNAWCDTSQLNGVCQFLCDGAQGPNGEASALQFCTNSGGTCVAQSDGNEYCSFP